MGVEWEWSGIGMGMGWGRGGMGLGIVGTRMGWCGVRGRHDGGWMGQGGAGCNGTRTDVTGWGWDVTGDGMSQDEDKGRDGM